MPPDLSEVLLWLLSPVLEVFASLFGLNWKDGKGGAETPWDKARQ
jgi:hypothetical protein